MKKFILVSHLQNRVTNGLLCCLILISHIFCATASADQASEDRNNALEALTHDKQSGLNQLYRLARRGDDRSYYLLGTLSLYGKFGVAQDFNKAEKLFLKSAENCYADSVVMLTKFYMQRGSQFFDPLKGNALKKRCAAKIADSARKAEELAAKKNAEELAAKKNAEELAAKKVADEESNEKEKLADQKTPSKKTKDHSSDKGITPSVSLAWQKILPIYEDTESSGSAVSITNRGHFLTNFHVIEQCDPNSIALKYNGLVGKARVLNYFSDLDVALLKVNAPTPFFAKFDTSDLRFGEKLFALGFPVEAIFGTGPSFSEGLLTNTKDAETLAKKEGFLLVSFPIASGNSGGPVFNQLGGLRGITSYGINPKALADFLKEEHDIELFIESQTLNFAVSGLKIAEWLDKIGLEISELSGGETYKNVEFLAQKGLTKLGKVECF